MGRKRKENRIVVDGDIAYIYLDNYDKPVLIDSSDIEIAKNYCWSAKKDSPLHIYVRARERVTKKFVLLHRVLMGVTDPNVFVDHINHNTLDNRRCNLRVCDRSVNNSNRIKCCRFSSASYNPKCKNNPWSTTCTIDGKVKRIGYFKTKEEAIEAKRNLLIENKIYFKGADYHL